MCLVGEAISSGTRPTLDNDIRASHQCRNKSFECSITTLKFNSFGNLITRRLRIIMKELQYFP